MGYAALSLVARNGSGNQGEIMMPNKHGGKRKGAGRPPGSRNRATGAQKTTLSELARDYTDLALSTLAEIASNGESESARVAAATALLDRGYGRPRQSVEMELQTEDRLSQAVREISARGSRPPMREN